MFIPMLILFLVGAVLVFYGIKSFKTRSKPLCVIGVFMGVVCLTIAVMLALPQQHPAIIFLIQ